MSKAWYDFLEQIREARSRLHTPQTVWFRGHPNGDWALVPGLHRAPNLIAQERSLFEEFERSAARLFEKRETDWQTLFDMQHYGLPTRLLDWTEVLGIAVAFATLDRHESFGEPAIFVLDPVRLNQYSGLKGIKRIEGASFRYKDVYWHNEPFAAQFPIAIAPPFQSDRMLAQKATFTVHGANPAPIEEQCPEAVVKLTIPLEALDGARQFLDHADLNSYRIFPDIVGMAKHIRRKHLGY